MVPVGNEACRVSPFNGGPEGWDFLGTTYSFSHIHLATYYIIFVDGVTELMFTGNDALCTKSASNSD